MAAEDEGDEAEIARLSALLAQPDEAIDLARAALSLATLADPALDPRPSLHALDALAEGLRDRLGAGVRADAAALGHYLGHARGFTGNLEHYYDPSNSYLNVVLERGAGLPITLSVIYMEVGRRVGLTVHGIGFPAHFIVGVPERSGMHYLDPFRGGQRLDRDDLVAQLRQTYGRGASLDARMLQPTAKPAIIVRMLNNLKTVYAKQGQWRPCWRVQHRLLALQPAAYNERRDWAVISLKAGRAGPAMEMLERCLATCPPDEREFLQKQRLEAQGKLAQWN